MPGRAAAAAQVRARPLRGRSMDASKPVPIACMLSPDEFKGRLAWIEKLTAEALLTHHVKDGTAHLFYRAGAKDRVKQLVRQEQACCGFLRFEMADHVAGVALTITAPAEARADAEALFAHLIPPVQASSGRASSCCSGPACGS